MALKYKVGDHVRIKSLDWYNKNKSKSHGTVTCGGKYFDYDMREWCGKTMTILTAYQTCYIMREDGAKDLWTDEMIEGLVESVEDRMEELRKIRTISLTDNNYTDKVEVLLNDYEYTEEDGKAYFIKKKSKYPKTYEECESVLGLEDSIIKGCLGYEYKLLNAFQKLLMCRDAYWKLAGEEMGLGKSWEPSYVEESWEQGSPIKYVIYYNGTKVTKSKKATPSYILAFPTEEMRNAFYEYFKSEIEMCKELL